MDYIFFASTHREVCISCRVVVADDVVDDVVAGVFFITDSARIKGFLKSSFGIYNEIFANLTIQGLELIFTKRTFFTKTFWSVVVLIMFVLGIYWSIYIYNGWCDQQVLTTITTTGK